MTVTWYSRRPSDGRDIQQSRVALDHRAQATAMGLFNATTAVTGIIAALATGLVAQWLNYGATCWTATGATVIGLLLFPPLLRSHSSPQTAQATPPTGKLLIHTRHRQQASRGRPSFSVSKVVPRVGGADPRSAGAAGNGTAGRRVGNRGYMIVGHDVIIYR